MKRNRMNQRYLILSKDRQVSLNSPFYVLFLLLVKAMKEKYKEIKAKEHRDRDSQVSLGTAALKYTQTKYGEGVN